MANEWKKVAMEKVEEPKGEIMSENTDNVNEIKVPVVDSFIVDVPDIPMPEMADMKSEIVEDECKGAFKFAFVGSGQGGCLSGKTNVYISELGMLPIKDMFEEHFAVARASDIVVENGGHVGVRLGSHNYYTLSVNPVTGKVCKRRVLAVWKNVARKPKRICVSKGCYLDCSITHPTLVFRRDERRLRNGMFFRTLEGQNRIVAGDRVLMLNAPSVDLGIPTSVRGIDVTEDMAWVLGVFAGDGSMKKDINGVNFYCDSVAVRDRVAMMGGLFGATSVSVKQRSGCWEVSYFGLLPSAIMRSVFCYLGGDKTDSIAVPRCVSAAVASVRIAFLAGLIASDGTVSDRWCEASISTCSERLADIMACLVYSLGGHCSISCREPHGKGKKRCWQVKISGIDQFGTMMPRLMAHVTHEKKVSRLGKWVSNGQKSFTGSLTPIRFDEINDWLTTGGYTTTNDMEVSNELSLKCWKRGESSLSRPMFRKMLDSLTQTDDILRLQSLADGLETVEKIVDTDVEEFYDLSIEEHENYFAGNFGLLATHNSRLAEAFWKLGYRRVCCVNCLDNETEALTQRGWIKGFELLRTDNLLTKNPNTNALEWQPLTDLKLYPDYDGPLVAFKSLSFDVVSTPEHRWLTTSKKTGKNVERKTYQFGENDTHRIHRTGDYLPICESGLTPDEAELLGWFVTDGGLQTTRKTPIAFIFQSWMGNREKCERISELLKRLDMSRGQVKLGKHKNGTYYRWTLGKHLSTLLYGRCPSRTLTVESMTDLDRPALDRLREAMILGDGCCASGKTVLCTGRKEQADAFQVLCTLTGAASGSVWRDMSMYSPHSEKMSNIPKSEGVWYVTILKRDKAQVVGNQRRDFTGKVPVWCPVVPNTFFVARRKGYVFITGNTTGQDLASINIPEANKLIMDVGTGGAGKDPSKGEVAAKKYYEDIYDLMRRCFGKKFDRIIVCIGAGGGTGSGSSNVLIDIAHDIAKSFKVEVEGGQPAVGVLVSLPKVSEGAKVNDNALHLLEGLFVKAGKGKGKQDGRTISPLIIVDNDRVEKIYPNLSVSQFWDVANKSISSLLHLFNSIAIQDSDYTTFDRADMEDVLSAGVVSFGACPIRKWDAMTDISFSIRDNLKNNVLVGGFDTAHARAAACVFIGHTEVLTKIPQAYLEHGFEMLTRIMKSGGVLHRGIYKGAKAGLVVYTMLGELGRPEERMSEIARIASKK